MSDDPKDTSTAPTINHGTVTIKSGDSVEGWRTVMTVNDNGVYYSGNVTLADWKAGENTTVIQGGTLPYTTIYNPGIRVGINLPLYLVSYSTESGDTGIVGLFNQLPTDQHLEAITENQYPDEIEDGVSYISYTVKRIDKIETLPPIA
jgi:hypothetical protein